MTEKTGTIKKEINAKTNSDLFPLVEKKIEFFKDVIQKTIIHILAKLLYSLLINSTIVYK